MLSHDSIVTEGINPNHVIGNSHSKMYKKSSLLKVYFANSRSICNKINELHVLLSSHEYDILVFCEMWLTDSVPDSLLLNGLHYSIHRVDRRNKIGGGTCIIHRSFLKTCPVPIVLSVDSIQMMCIDLVGSLIKYRLIACYTPPSLGDDCIVEFLNFWENGRLLDCIASIIVCGDFNIPSNRKLSRFLDLMSERGFNQCVNSPTRDSNILDLVFVNDSFAVSDVVVGPPFSISDHNSIDFNIVFLPLTVSQPSFSKYVFNDDNLKLICNDLQNTDWSCVFDTDNLETGVIFRIPFLNLSTNLQLKLHLGLHALPKLTLMLLINFFPKKGNLESS